MRNQETGITGSVPEARAEEIHGSIPWSGLSVDKARDLAANRQVLDQPRIASTVKARLDVEERSPVDAGESYPADDHALLYAYVLKGRMLQSLTARKYVGALVLSVGRLAQRLVLDPIRRWNEHSRRLHELRRLDDRMLKDIGISRSEIGFVAWLEDDQCRRAGYL